MRNWLLEVSKLAGLKRVNQRDWQQAGGRVRDGMLAERAVISCRSCSSEAPNGPTTKAKHPALITIKHLTSHSAEMGGGRGIIMMQYRNKLDCAIYCAAEIWNLYR